jgi:hypothetical protein
MTTIVNGVAINLDVQVSLLCTDLHFFRTYISPRSCTVGSYDSSMFEERGLTFLWD